LREPVRQAEDEVAAALIRRAGPADVDAIIRIQEESIMGLGVDAYGPAKARAWARFGVEQSADLMSQGEFFVAVVAGRTEGVAGWSPDVERFDTAWLRYVFVRPGAARRGLGRRLVETAERAVRAAGRRRLRLWSSLNAVPFYRALGYGVLRRAAWPVEPGVELEYLLMGKSLRPPRP